MVPRKARLVAKGNTMKAELIDRSGTGLASRGIRISQLAALWCADAWGEFFQQALIRNRSLKALSLWIHGIIWEGEGTLLPTSLATES